MKMALLKRNFDDAIREMDGARIFLCWKYMMLYFREQKAQICTGRFVPTSFVLLSFESS